MFRILFVNTLMLMLMCIGLVYVIATTRSITCTANKALTAHEAQVKNMISCGRSTLNDSCLEFSFDTTQNRCQPCTNENSNTDFVYFDCSS
ncbi:hypothetical protein SNE40_010073 [Patella caerulea]|uniref:Uncharacterized protein n=1 Tax=Patella caerulea TaxID=87958 RepID=A0AAN8PZG4_PATCE